MASIEQAGVAMEESRARGAEPAGDEPRVTPLELFFDLVFVFAVTQVTQLIADRPTWEGLAPGLVLLAVIWSTWAGYAWLTNALDVDQDRVRVVIFGAMGAMFVVALTIPAAFSDRALVFAVAYAVVRVAHVLLFGLATQASAKFPEGSPSLFVGITDSLGEQVQRALPGTSVVKALNTVNADVMVDPASIPATTWSSSAGTTRTPSCARPRSWASSAGPRSGWSTAGTSPARAPPRATC